jgi:hypothetical protein
VEPALQSEAELCALVRDYLGLARHLGDIPMRGWLGCDEPDG